MNPVQANAAAAAKPATQASSRQAATVASGVVAPIVVIGAALLLFLYRSKRQAAAKGNSKGMVRNAVSLNVSALNPLYDQEGVFVENPFFEGATHQTPLNASSYKGGDSVRASPLDMSSLSADTRNTSPLKRGSFQSDADFPAPISAKRLSFQSDSPSTSAEFAGRMSAKFV
jgi:hypothetical protein